MHKSYYQYFYFIDTLDINQIKWIKSNTTIIYRNYQDIPNIQKLLALKRYCKIKNIIFLISNNLKLVAKYKFDGLYLPSFNKKLLKFDKYLPKNKILCGSAHNLREIRIKEMQGVQNIFLSPIFQTTKNKSHLGVCRFNTLSNMTKKKITAYRRIKNLNKKKKKKITALGGIATNNIKKIKMTRAIGIAGISNISYILKIL